MHVPIPRPLLLTARCPHTEQGREVSEKNDDGSTTLMEAARYGYKEVVEYLVVREEGERSTPMFVL
jgi:dsRNA-specific ribonuclease